MTANINPETGVAYGYISSTALDDELVDALLYGPQSTNQSYQEALEEWKAANEDSDEQEFSDSYEDYEPIIHGEYEGVTYQTSWLGGALNFFIFQSPHITDQARMASPCVPNAAILDTLDGTITGYDVPSEWRVSI